MKRGGVAVAVVVALLGAGTACQQSAEEKRADYCDQVQADSEELTRIADEGGAGGFLEALPVLEGLAEKAPSDLEDEWRTFLNALHGLEEAVRATDLDPGSLEAGKKLPADMAPEDRRRVRQAAAVLREEEVTRAASGIEQHALDICDTPIL